MCKLVSNTLFYWWKSAGPLHNFQKMYLFVKLYFKFTYKPWSKDVVCKQTQGDIANTCATRKNFGKNRSFFCIKWCKKFWLQLSFMLFNRKLVIKPPLRNGLVAPLSKQFTFYSMKTGKVYNKWITVLYKPRNKVSWCMRRGNRN